MFETGSFSFNKPFVMKDRCDHCNQNFMPEPGFYYGAMYISYIFTGFFSFSFIALLHWGMGMSTATSFGILIFIFAIFFVYIFRLARAAWINANVSYDPTKV
ncbi:MAG: hypothetical protein DHS20C18_51940 [Saprospiraceae bacterium]|nr:MAG: hypothetical protein DHS20C18_51940 [Saprospiraceae bacterium]